MDMEEFRCVTAPPTCYYIPNFLTDDEADYLFERILSSPKPKWTVLSNRRLQNWGGILEKDRLIPLDEIPSWLQTFMCKVTGTGIFPVENQPNHVLINEYLPGQGIMPHVDGPAFFPTITTLNLGSHTLLDFYASLTSLTEKQDLDSRYAGSLLLEPKSLVILQDDMYTSHLHGIKEVKSDILHEKIFNLGNRQVGSQMDRSTRISVTIRNVPKVSKHNIMSLVGKH